MSAPAARGRRAAATVPVPVRERPETTPERAPLRAPRVPRWPVATALTALLALTAFFPLPLLRDAELPAQTAAGVTLVRSPLYIALAPLTTSLDELALLSVRQHISVIVGALLAYAAWRVARRRAAVRLGHLRLGALGELGGGVAFFALIFGVYTVTCLVPRPMASLAVGDPDLVRVDFHSHTEVSHDGRSRFDVERLRRWHRDGGFDVAYVTDHATWAQAERGVAANPARAGDGTVVLSGVEAWSGGEHLNVLGTTVADSAFLRADEQLVDAAVARALADGRRELVFIETVPGFLDTMAVGIRGGFPDRAIKRVTAVELSDAAPRGFDQTDSTYERVLELADSLDLAVVAGSDNHGWGRTAASWSLVPIPGWRDLSPEALGERIERRILERRRSAVRVVERGRPRTVKGMAMLLNVPVVTWHFFATLPAPERVSWLAWTWALALGWHAATRHRRRRGRVPLHVIH